MKNLILASVMLMSISTLAAEQKEWTGMGYGLTIDGDSAHLTETCGMIEIAHGWNTDGDRMTGDSCGGPLCNFKRTVTLTAKELDGKIYIHIDGDSQEITLEPGPGLQGMLCL